MNRTSKNTITMGFGIAKRGSQWKSKTKKQKVIHTFVNKLEICRRTTAGQSLGLALGQSRFFPRNEWIWPVWYQLCPSDFGGEVAFGNLGLLTFFLFSFLFFSLLFPSSFVPLSTVGPQGARSARSKSNTRGKVDFWSDGCGLHCMEW